jgi:hypothetical protein
MKMIITENQNERIKINLLRILETAGFNAATSSVGGVDNFIRIMNLSDWNPIPYLNLFNDLTIKEELVNGINKLSLYNQKGKKIIHWFGGELTISRDIIGSIRRLFGVGSINDVSNYIDNVSPFIVEWFSETFNLPVITLSFGE